ncbi:MAG: bifunctional 4-hydroxy-2-oxoglutarate aldolase/2-dehydro-3-deoxy-phosphogluconate aldolase [Chloroflexi bacterium]|nr:bifunctional 4-hydroxy-2-oxoglutarate aldolase/2-dehydro-3-deoxy-phosphogluconate aldolase [Chloroflexota bacterium]MCY3581769.1 bifunctional 4-hydroxy-2-oxoglutarate aldolase/2-dehydro-3-deoxy-phosphogluconate aldolase [Chloroflexota bacterium]MCY3714879.1 bifunctional 4-hydroxy-2-oxoglutarate aldolase/2-dehydro-3-deoxy-phosphogluconate aldolase [Chloroflexota bacterium]MDE2649179.1 bifunctional 4-hydroxy-2-oxoglutarate aldolase/2-dehydro-3-deoxy-phosphogluconate aldolase [Chloroflexota bact
MSALEIIAKHKLVAIVRLDDLSIAAELLDALVAGGIRAVEFTLTNPQATEVIAALRARVGADIAIGAGSVINAEQARAVAAAGAQFVVSPITKREILDECAALSLPAMPGAFTPSEIQQAWEWGAAVVKVFPANHLGRRYIKDVLAPLPHLRLMPTGGVSLDNLREYIEMGAFAVGLGSSLINNQAVAKRDWAALRDEARAYVQRLG